jgi:hypothetical protein
MIKRIFYKIFNKNNLIKIIIIFFVGLTTRIFINTYFNINVFTDYLSCISILYYFFFSSFIVYIHYIIDNANINIILKTFNDINSNILKNLIKFFKILINLKLNDFSIKNIRALSKDYFNNINSKNELMLLNSYSDKEEINSSSNEKNLKTDDNLIAYQDNYDKGKNKSARHYNTSSNDSELKKIKRTKRINSLSDSYQIGESSTKKNSLTPSNSKSLKISES